MRSDEKPNVLIVDDDPDWRESTRTFFSCHGHRCNSASTRDSALDAMHEFPNDLTVGFVDIHMHESAAGLDIIQYGHEVVPNRVVLYGVTGMWSLETERRVFAAGGHDLLLKDPDVIFERMLTRAQYPNALELVKKGAHDPLTNLKNLAAFEEDVHVELDRAKIRKRFEYLHLIAMDMDKLWWINDTYGHRAGDKCIQAVANIIRGEIRPYDHPARRSGDEFLVCIVGANMEDALGIAQSIDSRVKSTQVEVKPGLFINIGLTWGLAELHRDQISYPFGAQVQEFLNAADTALRKKKPAYDKALARKRK
jgi:diguanylate cyclase (GGDEF)-like protein